MEDRQVRNRNNIPQVTEDQVKAQAMGEAGLETGAPAPDHKLTPEGKALWDQDFLGIRSRFTWKNLCDRSAVLKRPLTEADIRELISVDEFTEEDFELAIGVKPDHSPEFRTYFDGLVAQLVGAHCDFTLKTEGRVQPLTTPLVRAKVIIHQGERVGELLQFGKTVVERGSFKTVQDENVKDRLALEVLGFLPKHIDTVAKFDRKGHKLHAMSFRQAVARAYAANSKVDSARSYDERKGLVQRPDKGNTGGREKQGFQNGARFQRGSR